MFSPPIKIKLHKHSASSLRAWLFAFIGMLAAGVNLQAGELDTDKSFNRADSAQVFVFSSASGSALVLERDESDQRLYTPLSNGFLNLKLNWRFVGLLKSAGSWAPALQSLVHLRPPLRAPPFK